VHLRSLLLSALAAIAFALSASWLTAASIDEIPDAALTAGPFTTIESGPASYMAPR
jgi:hypothetical protein